MEKVFQELLAGLNDARILNIDNQILQRDGMKKRYLRSIPKKLLQYNINFLFTINFGGTIATIFRDYGADSIHVSVDGELTIEELKELQRVLKVFHVESD